MPSPAHGAPVSVGARARAKCPTSALGHSFAHASAQDGVWQLCSFEPSLTHEKRVARHQPYGKGSESWTWFRDSLTGDFFTTSLRDTRPNVRRSRPPSPMPTGPTCSSKELRSARKATQRSMGEPRHIARVERAPATHMLALSVTAHRHQVEAAALQWLFPTPRWRELDCHVISFTMK